MSSFVSKTLSRLLLPNLEKDLATAVKSSLQSSAALTDCFLAPAVYGFERQQVGGGLGHATSALEQRIATATTPSSAPTVLTKVHYPAPTKGLFQ